MDKIKQVLLKAFTEGITLNQTEYDELLEEVHIVEDYIDIGKATEKAFEFDCPKITFGIKEYFDDYLIESIEELLDWAEVLK
jgi:hypothetical protein